MVVHGVQELGTSLYQYIMDDPQFLICVMEFYSLTNLWHKRLGHLNHYNIRFLGKQQLEQ